MGMHIGRHAIQASPTYICLQGAPRSAAGVEGSSTNTVHARCTLS
jgi:hypothetical protein